MGYLSDPKYMKYKGFETVDTASPYFELMYMPFDKNAEKPCFRDSVKKTSHNSIPKGFTIYYTSQCPFTAQNAPVPFTTFNLFYNGEFVTHEILSEKKFEKVLTERCM